MGESLDSAPGDRIVLDLDGSGPVELIGLTESFAALARMFERHHPEASEAGPPKLYITRLTTASVHAEIAPYVQFFGEAYPYIAAANTVGGFTKRLSDGLRAFCGLPGATADAKPSREDAGDLKDFIKPLLGKAGAKLALSHARYEQKDGERHTVVEYNFTEADLNRASVNIDRALEAVPAKTATSTKPLNEVLLYFDVASRSAGKEKGKTSDRAIVAEVTDKPLPTYFRKGVSGDPKDAIRREGSNPISNTGYIVDVLVQIIDDEPKMYIVTQVYEAVPLDA